MAGVQQAHKEDDLHRRLIRLVAERIEDAAHDRKSAISMTNSDPPRM
jgi:hypothetical protein